MTTRMPVKPWVFLFALAGAVYAGTLGFNAGGWFAAIASAAGGALGGALLPMKLTWRRSRKPVSD